MFSLWAYFMPTAEKLRKRRYSPFSALLCFKLSVYSSSTLITCFVQLLLTLYYKSEVAATCAVSVLNKLLWRQYMPNYWSQTLWLCVSPDSRVIDFGFGSRAFMVNPGFMKKQAIALVKPSCQEVRGNKQGVVFIELKRNSKGVSQNWSVD